MRPTIIASKGLIGWLVASSTICVIGVYAVARLPESIRRNTSSLALMHSHLLPGVAEAADRIGQACALAHTYYSASDYRQVVDLLHPIWLSASDVTLQISRCRSGALELAVSLEKLGRMDEAEDIYGRVVEINPSTHDWVMHFAQLALGDADLRRGQLESAQAHFATAYDSAVLLPEASRQIYEERAWKRLAEVVDAAAEYERLGSSTEYAERSSAASPLSPGWRVLAGLLLEEQCQEGAAARYYAAALELAPEAGFLKLHLDNLVASPRPCSP